MKEFNVSREVSELITTVFLLGYAFGVKSSHPFNRFVSNYFSQSLVWGPASELFGRKPVFVVSMVPYTIFHIGQALAPNIQTLLVTRFLSGLFSVAPLTNCGGTHFAVLYKFTGKLYVFDRRYRGYLVCCWTRACNQSFLQRSLYRHNARTCSFWIVCYFLFNWHKLNIFFSLAL